MSLQVLLLLGSLIAVVAATDLTLETARWPHTDEAVLEKNVHLFWQRESDYIVFEVRARAKGYVAIGFSPSGGMAGADIALGWVKDGKGTLRDLHAVGNLRPLVDKRQDWTLLDAEEANGVTVLHFSRKLETGDCDEDIAITTNTMRLMWAYSDSDPTTPDDIEYHAANRGLRSSHILATTRPREQVSMPDDVAVIEFRLPGIPIPWNQTTKYWCQPFRVPPLKKKHHVIKVIWDLDNEPILHHIIAYACFKGAATPTAPLRDAADGLLVDEGFERITTLSLGNYSHCMEATFGWAVGGDKVMTFPANVGVSLGEPNDPDMFLVEFHFNNQVGKDWVDRSGLRLFYTPSLRTYDVGNLAVGSIVSVWMFVPPKSIFTAVGMCQGPCLDNAVSKAPGGLRLFAYILHTHTMGRKMRVRHIRDGKQIGWLGRDEHYDFNYQEPLIFDEERIIQKGDQLVAECVFDSRERDNATFGGLRTSEEMCIVFFQYYPRVNLAMCASAVPSFLSLQLVENATTSITGVMESPSKYSDKYFSQLVALANWTKEMADTFQSLQTMVHILMCSPAIGGANETKLSIATYPSYQKLDDSNACGASANPPPDSTSQGITTTSPHLSANASPATNPVRPPASVKNDLPSAYWNSNRGSAYHGTLYRYAAILLLAKFTLIKLL